MLDDDVKNRLLSLGYTVTDSDIWVLNFCIDKITNHIKNNCNVSGIPDGLYERAVDLVCGEFLYGKLSQGQLDIEQAVKSIKEGDTEVTFPDGATDSERYVALVDNLRNTQMDFTTYRRLKW